MINWIRRQIHKWQTSRLIRYLKEENGMEEKKLPTEHFSILLGAGFSVSAQYPTAKQLNDKLSTIRATDIWIAPSFDAGFIADLTDGIDSGADMSLNERNFFEKFIRFYISKYGTFHYESFYDYYIQLRRGDIEDGDYETFYEEFCRAFGRTHDAYHKLDEFNRSFEQMIFNILYRYDDLHNGNATRFGFSFYRYFNMLVKRLPFIVHLHTLNHDIFVEQMQMKGILEVKLSDGFTQHGSLFYSKNRFVDYRMVRTQFFNNIYKGQYRYYKLHGSVDYLPFNFDNREITMIKTVHGSGFMEYYKEYTNHKGELDYFQCWINYVTSFLSGTTEKMRHYTDPYFYEKVFNHFKANLKNSKHLLTIGYGYGDPEINLMIETHFLSKSDSILVAVSPGNVPNHPFFNLTNVHHYSVGVANINLQRIEQYFGITLNHP